MLDIRRWAESTRIKAGVSIGAVLIVLVAVIYQLNSTPGGSGAADPAPTATATQSSGSGKLKVVVISGGQTGCTRSGGCGSSNYTQLLAYRQGWLVTSLAKASTGYAAGSKTTPTNYPSRVAAAIAAKPDLVIIEGSTSDATYPPVTVQANAEKMLEELRKALPLAKLVTVGPIYGGLAPIQMTADAQAVKLASDGRADLFIDPIAEGWFAGANAAQMGADHKHPSKAGHLTIAASIAYDLGQAGIVSN